MNESMVNDKTYFQRKITHLIRQEVAEQTPFNVFSFGACALVIYFYGFGTVENLWIIKVFALLILPALAVRAIITRKIWQDSEPESIRFWFPMKCTIWANCIFLGVIFYAAALELSVTSPHFVVLAVIAAGITSTSLATLSYDGTLFVPMQLLLIPPLIISAILELRNAYSTNALVLLVLMSTHLMSHLGQFKALRRKHYQRFNALAELEISNQKLKETQEELVQQTQNLVYTSRLVAVGEVSSGVSHEINNPLMIISGNIGFIEKLIVRGASNEKIFELINKSKTAIDRIAHIVEGLKSFSLQNRQIIKKTVTLSSILDSTFSMCFEMLKEHNIQLRIDSVPNVSIACIPFQIVQVLINLIKNADDVLTAMEDDSQKWISISFSETESEISIVVANGGPLIPIGDRDKIFQPFFTTKPLGKGVGLGLPISQGIIQKHDGSLSFDANATFTSFIITLPISDRPRKSNGT